jgi:hypothetical protein
LPAPAFEALVASLADVGLTLTSMDLHEPLWHAGTPGQPNIRIVLLRPPPPLPAGGRTPRQRAARPSALGSEVAQGRRRVGRGRKFIPRSLKPRGHDDVPAAPGGTDRHRVARSCDGARLVSTIPRPQTECKVAHSATWGRRTNRRGDLLTRRDRASKRVPGSTWCSLAQTLAPCWRKRGTTSQSHPALTMSRS